MRLCCLLPLASYYCRRLRTVCFNVGSAVPLLHLLTSSRISSPLLFTHTFSGVSVLRYHERLTVLSLTTLWFSNTLVSLHSGLAALDIIGPVTTRSKQFKMRAARYYGKEDVRIEHDVPAPPEQLMEGQVRVQPAFVGICGTGMRCSSPSNNTTKRY